MPASPRTIGFYANAGLEISHRYLEGILRYCDEVGGFSIRDFRMRDPVDDVRRGPPPWRGDADGIVLSVGRSVERSDQQVADWALGGGVPVVSVAGDWADSRIPCARVNAASLAQLAAEHLMQCGCASYLFFGFQGSTGSGQRAEAFRAALARPGHTLVECATSFRYLGDFESETEARGEKKLAALLRKMRQPIGVWALNDYFSCAVCVLCEALKLAVPEQVKVLGVDDFDIARAHRPTLSSIRTPGEQVGYLATQMLHRKLDGKRGLRAVTQVAATELVARASSVGAPPANGKVEAALEYIARHACGHLTVDQLAAALGISRSSLHVRFERSVGRSPGQEIQRVRLEKAKELLAKSQLSISRIALMVGFEETAALSKFFTKHMGVSPSEYREAQK